MTLANGTRLGPYEIVAQIGAGGMGDVYKARDTRLNRFVAIKTSREKYGERFEREMRAIASLSHPNICALYDVGPNYLVMELLEGQTLQQVLQGRRLSVDEAVRIAGQMAEALDAAHAKGITHRDIKPGNVFVSPRGHVKVLDFGLAKVAAAPAQPSEETKTMAEDLSQPGTAMGTVAYMAPEQARGLELDARADLWSLGVVLYEMLTGSRPFEGATNAVVFDAIFNKAPQPVSQRADLAPELDRAVNKLLEKDRDLRYQSAAEVSVDLRRVEKSSGTVAAPAVSNKSSRWWVAAAIAVVAIGGGAWLAKSRLKPAPLLTSKDIIVVADFDNRTGDPVFDVTLREALATKLQQSELLLPMSAAQVREFLTESKRDANTPLTANLANEVCIRAGEKATLAGTISALGANYVLMLKATGCQQGNVLASAQAEAQGKEQVMTALSAAVDELRGKLGETLASADRPGRVPGRFATTASLEAFQAYSIGMAQFRQGQLPAAAAALRRAREIDPIFAFAWNGEGFIYMAMGQADVGRPLIDKGFELREHASPVERLTLEGVHYMLIGDLDKARVSYEEVLQLAPRMSTAMNELGRIYAQSGDQGRAVEMAKRVLELDPFAIGSYGNLMFSYIRMDRFVEAKALAESPFVKKTNPPGIHQLLLNMAYLEGDLASAEKEQQALERTPLQGSALGLRVRYLLGRGKFREAETSGKSLQELGIRTNSQALGNTAAMDLRERKALAGDCGFLKGWSGPPPSADLLLRCGEVAQAAKRTEQDLARPDLSPDDAALARARLALAKREPQQTVDALEPLRRLDNSSQAPALRGLAYLELKKPAEAAAEFRKLIARRSQSLNAEYPWAHVQLARALAQAGDAAEAKKTYEAFFTLWKDADPGIPLLEAARKEYAALGR